MMTLSILRTATATGRTRLAAPRKAPARAMSAPRRAPMPAAAAAAAADAASLASLPFPPHAPLAGSEAGSFAEGTIKTRLPAILDTVISDLQRLAASDAGARAAADAAISDVKKMQAEMPADGRLSPLAAPTNEGAAPQLPQIVAWTNAAVEAWQQRGEKMGFSGGWLGLPWLVVECYMYVRLACIMASQPALAKARYDPFALQKLQALVKSGAAVAELAAAGEALVLESEASAMEGKEAGGDRKLMERHLKETFQYALWGNKTDLSMLVDASKLDVNASVRGAAAGAGAGGNLIVDEFAAVWKMLDMRPDGGWIDLVLDNAGLELYTDLLLADFLVSSGQVETVNLHGKLLPWFVSDTMAGDLEAVLAALEAPNPPAGMQVDQQQWGPVQRLAQRWRDHVKAGRWVYKDHPFWTTPFPYWWMEQISPDLYKQLSSSKLIIFKGDLNYRKLAYDCRWPLETPFPDAVGPFKPAPFVTLRTLKADVMAGLAPGQGGGWMVWMRGGR